MPNGWLCQLRKDLLIGAGLTLAALLIGWLLPAVIPQSILITPESVDAISITYHGKPIDIDNEAEIKLLNILSKGSCTRRFIQTRYGYASYPQEKGYIHMSIHELRLKEPSISTNLVLGEVSRMSRSFIGTDKQTEYCVCDYKGLTQQVDAVLMEIVGAESQMS